MKRIILALKYICISVYMTCNILVKLRLKYQLKHTVDTRMSECLLFAVIF
jgi:hypothetical protein